MPRGALLATMLAICGAAQAQEIKREVIYGSEMMTRSERDQYRQDLQRAKGADEATKVRERHREQMQKRARARGEKLNDTGLLEKDKDAK